MRKAASIAILLASLASAPAAAAPWTVDIGRGNAVQWIGIGKVLLDRPDIDWHGGWQLDRLWVARLAYWSAEHPRPAGKHLVDASLMPTLRLAPREFEGMQPFVEAAIGAHLLSRTSIDDRQFSTAFQFGEQLGVGVRLVGGMPLSISVRGEHVSNGGIKHPNAGLTSAVLRVQLEWR
jgi:hypothetical protein